MNQDCMKCFAGLVPLLYFVTALVAGVPISQKHWLIHRSGYMGFWNDCNSTGKHDSEHHCTFTSAQDATPWMHVSRGCYVTGYILWWFSLIARHLSWRQIGSNADFIPMSLALLSAALIASSIGIFRKVFKEKQEQTDIEEVRFGWCFYNAITGNVLALLTVLAILCGFLAYRDGSLCQNSAAWCPVSCCCFAPIRKALISCKRKLRAGGSGISPEAGGEISQSRRTYRQSSVHTRAGDRGRGGGGGRGSAPTERNRGLDIETELDGEDSSSLDSSYSDIFTVTRGRPRRGAMTGGAFPLSGSHTHGLPPAYEDLAPPYSRTPSNHGPGFRPPSAPPPAYDDVITNHCERVVSPPPSYTEAETQQTSVSD